MNMDQGFYRSHFLETPKRIFSAIDRWKPDAKVILDFGCGLGIKTLSCAVRYPDAEVIGLDVTRAFEKADAFVDRFLDGKRPENLRYVQTRPGTAISNIARPDVICSWSVLEHVRRDLLPTIIKDMHAALSRTGLLITQIAPLYYSPFGSHLRSFSPDPWDHLLLSHDDFREKVISKAGDGTMEVGSADWMFARYEDLNKLTAAELFAYFEEAGFSAEVVDTRKVTFPIPSPLLKAYDEEALRTFEVFIVHRP